ncbi:MAG: pyridoxal-phosphate dependent enzyme [Flavobacteriia bacterium]|nr:pyridoxal-phosphate dependent enzyme [Flavobacteriia bacterium]
MNIDTNNSIVYQINSDFFNQNNLQVFVKRDDLIHPIISGNKWRKLKYNIHSAINEGKKGILTFGGAYSNHLHATAYACKMFSLKSLAFVRGEELNYFSNTTLMECNSFGMELIFLNRKDYSLLKNDEKNVFFKKYLNDYYYVPEGGANIFGIEGAREIIKELDFTPDFVFCAQGTSTTSCGILLELPLESSIIVVPVLKGYFSLNELNVLLQKYGLNKNEIDIKLNQVNVLDQYHFGGYGKHNSELISFIQFCKNELNIPLDHVYTAKVFYALYKECLKKEYKNKKILFVHTGGLQGSGFWKN